MKLSLALAAMMLAGCSTLQGRMDSPAVYSRSTSTSLADFQSCFVAATADQNVNYLPRGSGGTFTATAGPQNYVMWAVTIDDLGNSRRVEAHAVGPSGSLARKIDSCLR